MFQGPQHVPALPHHSRKHGEKKSQLELEFDLTKH